MQVLPEQSEPTQKPKKRKVKKPKMKDEVRQASKRRRPNPPPTIQPSTVQPPTVQPPIFWAAPPPRRATLKRNAPISTTVTDEDDDNEDQDDEQDSDAKDETWAPSKKEKKKAELKRKRGQAVPKKRSNNPTPTPASAIPNTSVFKIEKVQEPVIEKTSTLTKPTFSTVGPGLLAKVCEAMTREGENLRQKKDELKDLACVLRRPNLDLAKIDDVDPWDDEFDFDSLYDSDDDDGAQVDKFFEIHTEFGHRGPASWIPSLAKVRNSIPQRLLPTTYLFWDFCLHQGVFDGSLETRAKYEKERVRRWRVLKDLKRQGITNHLPIFGYVTTLPRKPPLTRSETAMDNGKELSKSIYKGVSRSFSYFALV
jgi:hypothetical protein